MISIPTPPNMPIFTFQCNITHTGMAFQFTANSSSMKYYEDYKLPGMRIHHSWSLSAWQFWMNSLTRPLMRTLIYIFCSPVTWTKDDVLLFLYSAVPLGNASLSQIHKPFLFYLKSNHVGKGLIMERNLIQVYFKNKRVKFIYFPLSRWNKFEISTLFFFASFRNLKHLPAAGFL